MYYGYRIKVHNICYTDIKIQYNVTTATHFPGFLRPAHRYLAIASRRALPAPRPTATPYRGARPRPPPATGPPALRARQLCHWVDSCVCYKKRYFYFIVLQQVFGKHCIAGQLNINNVLIVYLTANQLLLSTELTILISETVTGMVNSYSHINLLLIYLGFKFK